jgi:hypothetical protein
MTWEKRYREHEEKLLQEALRLSKLDLHSKTDWRRVAFGLGVIILAIVLYYLAVRSR